MRLRLKIRGHRMLEWLVNLALLELANCALFTVLFKYIEDVSWLEAVFQVWQTVMTVGYGNRPAATISGRWATIILGSTGIALLGTTITALFDFYQWQKERRKLGLMKNPYTGGYVIFNFPGSVSFKHFVTEVRCREPEVNICVVDNSIESLPEDVATLLRVNFVRGSLLNKKTYEQANVSKAKIVLVFPTDLNDPHADAITQSIVEIVLKIVEATTRVIYFIVDPDHEWLFENRNAVGIRLHLNILVGVQESEAPYSSRIFEHLCHNTREPDPNTVKPNRIIGWTWGDVCTYCIPASNNLQVRFNPFALIREKIPDEYPLYTAIIKKDDLLSVIADHNFNWGEFEEEMARCKNNAQ